MANFKGAFSGCNWCYGNGCMMCDKERIKATEAAMQPIFVAQRDNPEDMEALGWIASAKVLAKSGGDVGQVVESVNERAAVESLLQLLRNREKAGEA